MLVVVCLHGILYASDNLLGGLFDWKRQSRSEAQYSFAARREDSARRVRESFVSLRRST